MSTYSQNLRVELIGSGAQAGTWGTTTNNNYQYVFEQAISGSVAVSVLSQKQALTYTSGPTATSADNQAVFATLILTTSTSAAFEIYTPPTSNKQYVVYNSSSYDATIYNSTVLGNTTAAGTGVVVPAGKTVTVWTNGTNYYVQNNHFPGVPTAATASFGTSTTQVATTAFVQAASQAALQVLHPVGSIYTSTSSTNPGTSFGFGTWVAIGAGRVLIGAGGGYTAGDTGGSADAVVVSHTHTLTDPGHAHGYLAFSQPLDYTNGGVYPAAGHGSQYQTTSDSATTGISVNSAGVSGTGANLQPYLVVYMWNRTA